MNMMNMKNRCSLLRVAGVLEGHIFEIPEVRRCSVCISNCIALTAKARCNSRSSNYADGNNTDNESLKPDLQLKSLIQMCVEVITMGTQQITKEKPQEDT